MNGDLWFIGKQPGRRRTDLWVILGALGLWLAGGVAVPAADTRVIGGNAIIPINPDFSPDTQLFIPQNDPTGVNFLDNPVSNLLGLNQSLQVQIQVPVALGAALSSAISAGNRPSVLTPYSGILYGSGEDAVFDSFGSLVTNKASTLGKGKIGIGLYYQHSRFDEFDGEDIGKTVTQTIRSEQTISGSSNLFGNEFGFETVQPFSTTAKVRAWDVEFIADVVTLSLTYGLLENLDIGALIPYIFLQSKGRVEIDVQQSVQVQTSLNGELLPAFPVAGSRRTYKGKFDRDFEGLGDIILFSKWQLLSQYGLPKRIKGPVDLALQTEVKLATGDDQKFLGTGNTDVALRILVQRELTDRIRARAEVGYNYSGLGSEYSAWEYKVGGEFRLADRLSASTELIGSYSRAFEGIVDVAAGAKWGLSRDFKVFAGVRVPVNNNGLRYSWSPILGVEYTFSPPPKGGLQGLEPLEMAPLEMEPLEMEPIEPAPIDSGAPQSMAPAPSPAAVQAAPVTAAPAASVGPALSLEPIQSLHVVGPKPKTPAASGQSGTLPMPAVRAQ